MGKKYYQIFDQGLPKFQNSLVSFPYSAVDSESYLRIKKKPKLPIERFYRNLLNLSKMYRILVQ